MIIYGIDLRDLPQNERSDWLEYLNGYQLFTTDIFNKAGVVVSVFVYWEDDVPITDIIKIPKICSCTEVAPGYEDLYRAKILGL